jgi:PAS domain S-box-containing protein
VRPWLPVAAIVASLPAIWHFLSEGSTALATLAVVACAAVAATIGRIGIDGSHGRAIDHVSTVVERMSNSAAILDADERVRWVNPAFIRLYGFSAEEAEGQRLDDLLKTERADRQQRRDIAQELRRHGAAHGRIPRRAKDGRVYWVDHEILSVVDARGDVSGYVVVETDMTSEIELRDALERSERRFHDAADATPVFIWALDPNGHCTYVNRSYADFFGRPVAELLGKGWQPYIHPDDLDDVCRRVEAGLRSRLPFQISTRKRRADGRYRWLVCNGRPHFTESGEFVGFLGGSMDVTEQREAELQAQAANRAKSEFVTNMSHELRTPLTAILGYAELLQDGTSSAAVNISHDEAIASLRRNGEQLLALIDDILDLSRIETGELRIAPAETDVQALVEDVVATLDPRAAAQGLDLEAFATSDVPRRIVSDPLRLRQVLLNLVGNAVKFTSSGGVKVVLRGGRSQDGRDALVIAVADTGIGMNDETLAKLFRPFVQADASLTRRHGGTGLGLCICQRLVSMLGGEIHVSSVQGRGSTFSVILDGVRAVGNAEIPAGTRLHTPRAPRESFARRAQPLAGARVLLAEDGPDNQRLIAHLVRKAGADVTIVPDGRLAVDAVLGARTTAPFDLVLMDMQMPELDGYSAARDVRAAGCDVPIVAITAHAMVGDREKCLAAGCDDYLTKPITYDRLLEACVPAIEARRRAAA